MINRHHLRNFLKKVTLFLFMTEISKVLATAIFKLSKVSLQISKIVESRNENTYNLRYNSQFPGPFVKSIFQRIEHISFHVCNGYTPKTL